MLSCIQRNHRKPAPSVFFCSWEVLLLNSYRETRVYQLGDRSSQRCGGMTEVEVLRTRRLGESFTGRFSCEISLGTAFSWKSGVRICISKTSPDELYAAGPGPHWVSEVSEGTFRPWLQRKLTVRTDKNTLMLLFHLRSIKWESAHWLLDVWEVHQGQFLHHHASNPLEEVTPKPCTTGIISSSATTWLGSLLETEPQALPRSLKQNLIVTRPSGDPRTH